jgi:hypothetical protein
MHLVETKLKDEKHHLKIHLTKHSMLEEKEDFMKILKM